MALLGAQAPASGQSYRGTGYRIIDGDTIHLLRETGQIVRVELYGVDAPERGQPYGAAAAALLRTLVFQIRVHASAEARDEDGRPRFVISVEDRNVNERLLRAGLAWWDRRQAPHNDRFQRLEHQAQVEEKGLWAQSAPTPPWEWREKKEGS